MKTPDGHEPVEAPEVVVTVSEMLQGMAKLLKAQDLGDVSPASRFAVPVD
jgi:hypothetical protein